MKSTEYNIDGLIGPTHFFGGLGHGNVASKSNAGRVSQPKAAALQGLDKMKQVASLGIDQLVMPPHPRPAIGFLDALGYVGNAAEKIRNVAMHNEALLPIIYSSSAMWAANAATVSASADTPDGRIHMTPANLISNAHRALEAGFTSHALKQIFSGECFQHHPSLPYNPLMGDEGAANHMRLCNAEGAAVNIFTYGAGGNTCPKKYTARQHKIASEAIIRKHGLRGEHTVLLQQNPDAIDAGVFHNDVIATSNGNFLVYHEQAYADDAPLTQALERIGGLVLVKVGNGDLALLEAVKSYLFNSQILTLPDGQMVIVSPMECEESTQASRLINRLIQAPDNPIAAVQYVDVKQSMSNGGGPACLRLRVWMNGSEAKQIHQGAVFSEALYERLGSAIEQHYPEQLSMDDLKNPELPARVAPFFADAARILGLDDLYDGWL